AIHERVTITSVTPGENRTGVIELAERTATGMQPYGQRPIALFSHYPIKSDPLEASVRELADTALSAAALPDGPVGDILARRPPRLEHRSFDASSTAGAVTAHDLEATVRSLDDSYLAVQGPPGAGKTYLGSHVV